jgi:hypothetical protein
MKRSQGFWVLAWLSASCAVRGFTIQDELPGASGGSGGSGGGGGSTVAGSQSGDGATQSQGGDGAAGITAQGGKAGGAGSQNEAGSPTVDGGEPSLGGADGAGGAPPERIAPCQVEPNGQPPLLCDDFESGALATSKWSPGPGVGITIDEGPHGATQLVHLNGAALETTLADLPITEAAGPVTVSFWVKSMTDLVGQAVVSFRDRSAQAAALRVSGIQKELGWRNSGTNVFVPQAPTNDQFIMGTWTCVSITLATTSLELRYQAQGFATVATLIADDEPTPNVDVNWNQLPADNRFVSGYPSFAGIVDGVAANLLLDDVRIVQGTSNVCGF